MRKNVEDGSFHHGDIHKFLSGTRVAESSTHINEDVESPYTITANILKARSKKIDRGNCYAQVYTCLVLTLGPISTGYMIGYMSTVMCEMLGGCALKKQAYHQVDYASVLVFGFALGNIVFTTVSLHKGPRRVLLFVAPINLMVVLAISIEHSFNFQQHLMFFWSFLTSSYTPCGFILMSDLIHEANYYACCLIFNGGHGLGILLAFITGARNIKYFTEVIQAMILILYYAFLLYLDESPVILYQKNPKVCERVLRDYRGSGDIQTIMRMIAKDSEIRMQTVNVRIMFTYKVIYKAFTILIAVALMQVIYLYYIFLFYNISSWTVMMVQSNSQFIIGQYWDGMILGLCYFFAPLFSQMVLQWRTFGLRKHMIFSAVTIPIIIGCLALYFYLLDADFWVVKENRWPILGLGALLIVCFNIGHSGSIELMINDYLPEQMNIWASLSIISLRYIFISISLRCTHWLQSTISAYIVISIYFAASLLGIPFTLFCIVEPTGKTLQQVQLEIGGNPIGSRSVYRRKFLRYWEIRQSRQKRSPFTH